MSERPKYKLIDLEDGTGRQWLTDGQDFGIDPDAVPELLEALNWALDVIDAGLSSAVHKGHVDYDQARAAIAKAEGVN